MESPWIEGTKVFQVVMTKMVAMSIFDLLQNPKASTLVTLYVGLGTQVLQISLNDDPPLTLALFMARSTVVHYAVILKNA